MSCSTWLSLVWDGAFQFVGLRLWGASYSQRTVIWGGPVVHRGGRRSSQAALIARAIGITACGLIGGQTVTRVRGIENWRGGEAVRCCGAVCVAVARSPQCQSPAPPPTSHRSWCGPGRSAGTHFEQERFPWQTQQSAQCACEGLKSTTKGCAA